MSLTFNYPPHGLTVVSLDRGEGRERGGKIGRELDGSLEEEGDRSFNDGGYV